MVEIRCVDIAQEGQVGNFFWSRLGFLHPRCWFAFVSRIVEAGICFRCCCDCCRASSASLSRVSSDSLLAV